VASWHSVGIGDMLPAGGMREVVVDSQEILLARVGNEYYATPARCPHLRGHLARGRLEGVVVTCPRHGSRFDVSTGEIISWAPDLPGVVQTLSQVVSKPRPLATFPVRVEDGQVWIQV